MHLMIGGVAPLEYFERLGTHVHSGYQARLDGLGLGTRLRELAQLSVGDLGDHARKLQPHSRQQLPRCFQLNGTCYRPSGRHDERRGEIR